MQLGHQAGPIHHLRPTQTNRLSLHSILILRQVYRPHLGHLSCLNLCVARLRLDL